jgi:hypothetical protein
MQPPFRINFRVLRKRVVHSTRPFFFLKGNQHLALVRRRQFELLNEYISKSQLLSVIIPMRTRNWTIGRR